jgi:hypothetical protein
MEPELRKNLTMETKVIGDQILAATIEDQHGVYWRTMDSDAAMNTVWVVSETLYQGTSGIVLFLLRLYQFSGDQKYLDCALKGCHWMIWNSRQNPSDNYAFYTGRMGTVFVLTKVSELTKEAKYLEAALEMAAGCSDFLKRKNLPDDIMNGVSGALLSLLHLHQASQKEWVMEKIREFLVVLVNKIHLDSVGFYWDRLPHHIKGLTGFGHGASGIAFVFLEAGYYLKNEACYGIAKEAFKYEDQYFNAEKLNWPDFRKGVFTEDDKIVHQREYLNENIDFFREPKFMNAWCHGAAGIGIARSRASFLLNEQINGLEHAIGKIIETNVASDLMNKSFTLCHGGGGNAEVLLLENEEAASEIAAKALKQKSELGYYISGYGKGEDNSLFLGNAGIGHFFLRILEPESIPSITAPQIIDQIGKIPDILSFFQINEILFNKLFGRTLYVLNKYNSVLWSRLSGLHQYIFTKEHILGFMKDEVAKAPQNVSAFVVEIFNLELEKLRMIENIFSLSYLQIQHITEGNKAINLLKEDDENFLNAYFSLFPRSKFIASNWDWSDWRNVDLDKKTPVSFFLKPHVTGILELKLTSPLASIDSLFDKSRQGQELATLLKQYAPHLSWEHIVAHLRELVKYGILTIGEKV